jgi:ABC-type nitrate/sulfonate/bicarbonate transport system permease component
MRRRLRTFAVQIALPFALVIAWWLFTEHNSSAVFPSLATDLVALRRTWLFAHFESDLVPSLLSFVVGYSIGALAGVMFGVPIGLSARIRRDCLPMLEFFRSLPIATVIPAGLLLLGTGLRMEFAVIAFGSVWPILINTIDGVRGVDPLLVDTAKVFGFSRVAQIRYVVLPAALPRIFAGGRIAVAIGILTMVLSTMIGATSGLGYQVIVAQESFDAPDAWAGLILIGLLGCLMNIVYVLIQRRILAWHAGWRGAVGSE